MKTSASVLLLSFALLPDLAQAIGQTTRISVNSAGGQASSSSISPSISADGHYVAFSSWAGNLVIGDTGWNDIFVHNRQTGKTSRISIGYDGSEANGASFSPSFSADGRYVAFMSTASNLIAGDSNGSGDVFVYDRQSGKTERVSVDSTGKQADYGGSSPSISADGRYVAFMSGASNLVSGDSNGYTDVFVHDRQTGKTERVSVNSAGEQGLYSSVSPSISADGRYVAFTSFAPNLISEDTNETYDTFVHDRQTGKTSRVSIDTSGAQANGGSGNSSISANGRYVAFSSYATNLVTGDTNEWQDVFVHDRQTGKTERVSVDSAGSQADYGSHALSISADGRYVAFDSLATNLVSGDTNNMYDTFIHDLQTGKTTRVNVDSHGHQANFTYGSYAYSSIGISAGGRYVAFVAYANNLVEGDTNGYDDIFVRDRLLQPQNQADISLILKGPSSVVKGNNATYKFIVTNKSNVNADNAMLTSIISNHGSLKSIVSSQGKCTAAAVPVCRLRTLLPGQRVTVTATITINGKTTISATAEAAPKDDLPSNNAQSLMTLLQ